MLPPGWCYMQQSDLAEMGQHAFRWLAPHRVSLAFTVQLHMCYTDMYVVHAGRGRFRFKNIISGAQLLCADRARV